MSPLELLALSKSVEEKAQKCARSEVKPGKYEVDFTARIKGIVTVGEDTERSQTAISLETVATALYFSGALRERAIDAIMGAVEGKIEVDSKRKAYVDTLVDDLRERFAQLPKKKCAGPVKAAVLVEAQ